MRKLILLLFAALALFADLSISSCTMHVARNPSVWHPERRTIRHWGARRHFNQRRSIWGKRRYGPRPHAQRGRYHQ